MKETFEILTDSTFDLMPKQVDELNISVVPMSFQMEGVNYLHYHDFRQMSLDEFYTKLKKNNSVSTSQTTPHQFYEQFLPFAKEGKNFLYISFSSGLSGTYDSSILALDQLRTEFPNVTMHAVDSLSASGGEGLVVYLACKMRKNGATLEETKQWVEQKASKHIIHWVSIDNLTQLSRGGRINPVLASVGNLLHVKPILYVTEKGTLNLKEKCRGNKAKYQNAVDTLTQKWFPDEYSEIIIFHANAKEDALKLKTLLEEQEIVKQYQPHIMLSQIGPVIASHTGQGAVCMAFYGTER